MNCITLDIKCMGNYSFVYLHYFYSNDFEEGDILMAFHTMHIMWVWVGMEIVTT